jgi:hypothetical protein
MMRVELMLLLIMTLPAQAQWQSDQRLTNNTSLSYTSQNGAWCVAAAGDVVHAVWYDYRDGNSEIYYKRSTDGGATWGGDTRLSNNASVSRYPSLAVAGVAVHVVWNDSRDGNSEIYYKRSTDGGATWGGDTRLSNNASASEYPSLAVVGAALHLVWVDTRDGNGEIYYKRSTDGGATWGADTRLTNNSSISWYPSVAVAGSAVHVAWHDYRDGNYEIYYKRSTDGGATWGSDTRLSNNAGISWFPSIAVAGSAIHVAWHDNRDGNYEIYHKRSTDGGATWGADTRLTNSAGSSEYPSLAAAGTAVHVVWNDARDGNGEIYFKRSTDGGATWDSDTRLTNNASTSMYPSVAVAGPRVHVVWYDGRDGNAEIYHKRNPTGNPWPDVGCTRILAPTGAFDSGTTVTPACSTYNYGSTTAGYLVRMRIGAGYNQTASVAGHAPGTRVYVTFPTWTATARGGNAVSCSTELAGDMVTANDKQTGAVTVNVHDVGTKILLAPAGTITPGSVVTPACSVFNFGMASESYNVRMKIGTVYDQTAAVAGHTAGATVYVTFPTWTAAAGTFAVTCSTELAADLVKANDKRTGSVTGGGAGGWTSKSPMPTGAKALKDGAWLTYNAGSARVFASRGYGTSDFFEYNPAKDSWKRLAAWPTGTEGKLPSKGSTGCATGSGVVYAAKGNNTRGFYRYDGAKDTWYQKKDVPLGLSNKKVRGGADIVWAYKAGTGHAYLLKGYKNEFWRYHTDGDSWHALADAPIGGSQKWDKGSWLAYDGARTIYAHKAKYHEFYKYDIETNAWNSTALPGMPIPGSGGTKKSKDGGCGVYTDAGVYALKGGNTQEFWKYAVAANSWTEKDAMPRGALNKKVKAGANIVAAGAVLYATKGNKSNEFWMYTPGAFMLEAPRPDGAVAGRMAIEEWRLTISPNPLATGLVHVVVGGTSLSRPALVRLYDAAGRCVGVWKPLLRNGATDLDVRHLAAGVYLVRVEADGFTASQKLVVQR